MSSYTIDHKFRSRYVSTKTAGELKYCNSVHAHSNLLVFIYCSRHEGLQSVQCGIFQKLSLNKMNTSELVNESIELTDLLKLSIHILK